MPSQTTGLGPAWMILLWYPLIRTSCSVTRKKDLIDFAALVADRGARAYNVARRLRRVSGPTLFVLEESDMAYFINLLFNNILVALIEAFFGFLGL